MRLRALAADARFTRRADDLQSLAAAVEDEDNDDWTGIDLFAAFPAGSAVAVHDKALGEHVAGILAATSAFLPVAWTWWSFHAATEAYKVLLSRGQENGRTFLSLWTTGFDGELTSWHRIIPTAQVSVVLIVLAIFFIVIHRLVAHSTANREEDHLHEAQSELTACITLAQRLLDQRRADDPGRIEAMIKRSVRDLMEAHAATKSGSVELREAATEMRTSLSELIASATEANTAAKASADASTEANADLQAAVDRTLKDLSATVQTHVRELRTGTKAALDEARKSASSAGTAISAEVAKVAESQQAVATGVAELSTASGGIATELRTMLTELDGSLKTINDSLTQHESAMQAQVTELSLAHDSAERMLRALEQVMPTPAGGMKV